MVVVVVVMVEDHTAEEEVMVAKVCVQLVYHLVSVCFVKEEMNCFWVMSVFMILKF